MEKTTENQETPLLWDEDPVIREINEEFVNFKNSAGSFLADIQDVSSREQIFKHL